MLGKLILQILSVSVITWLIGSLLAHMGINIIIGCLFGVLLQYGIYNAYSHLLDFYIKLKAEKIENERLKVLVQQTLQVDCPCAHRVTEIIPIRLDRINSYKCKACSKNISVYINAETALASDIIVNNDIDSVDNLLKTKLNESA